MCNETCDLIKKFITSFGDPMYATIPDTFWEYFSEVETDARTCYRKAKRNRLVVRKVLKIDSDLHKDIIDIFNSKPIRQHREVGHLYNRLDGVQVDLFKEWPNKNYKIYDCPKHYMDFYGCFSGIRLVGYLELLHSNGLATVYSTMGHAEFLKYGIMKYLFLEAVRMNIGKIKYLQYGNYQETGDRLFFVKDLKISNHGLELLKQISYA